MGGKSELKRLTVNNKWCKGCGICVKYCPKNVLMLQRSKVQIVEPEECIKCGLCEQRCPDYAIYLRGKEDE
jgi:2-oxoglutarate ferredoxin oxidoreductase subunit delta